MDQFFSAKSGESVKLCDDGSLVPVPLLDSKPFKTFVLDILGDHIRGTDDDGYEIRIKAKSDLGKALVARGLVKPDQLISGAAK